MIVPTDNAARLAGCGKSADPAQADIMRRLII